MKKSKLMFSLALLALFFSANVSAQDAITWSTQRNGAKLAIQKTFFSNKISTSNYYAEPGIFSINKFYDISDMTAFSALATNNPVTDQYNFCALLPIIVKAGKYKVKMEVLNIHMGKLLDIKHIQTFKEAPCQYQIWPIVNKVTSVSV